MPIVWIGTNLIVANLTSFEHQDSLLAVLGTLLLLSSWIAARIDRTERQLQLPNHKVATK